MPKVDKKIKKEKDKKILTIFILFFPSIILMALSGIPNTFIRFGIQLLIVLYQFIVIRNLVFEYYGEYS